jgi:O-antigen/teichoic acid export membrane protein
MNLRSALIKSLQVKFFDMSVFFIVSLITFRYFEIEERGLLSIFWAAFFIIELFTFQFGVTIQAKIPAQIIKKDVSRIQNTIFSAYLLRSFSGLIIGLLVFIFSEQLALILTPENIDHLRLKSVLNGTSLFLGLNIILGPIDHSVLIAFQKYQKMRLFLAFKIVPTLLSALLTLALKESPEFMILSYMFIRLTIQTYIGWHIYFHLVKDKSILFKKFSLDLISIKSVTKHALPLWISTLLAASIPHISIFMLGTNSNVESVAKFSLAMSLFMAGIAFVEMIDGWLVPKLSEKKLKNKLVVYSYLNDYYNLYFYTSTFFSILIIIFSELMVKIIAGDEYESSATLLIALCCFMNLRTLLTFRTVIYVFMETTIALKYVIYKFIIEIIFMFILIPIIGVYGILIAMLLSHFIIGQLFVIKVMNYIFNIKDFFNLFFNKFFYMSFISSMLISILLYLQASSSVLFYPVSIIYMVFILFLINKKKGDFQEILSL